MKQKPKYLITYQCKTCGQKSSFADLQEVHCRYCDESVGLIEISKEEITPELMEQQMKASVERMFTNLQLAFESMTEEDKAAFGDKDAEKEMLLVLAKAKKFKEDIEKLKLKRPEK